MSAMAASSRTVFDLKPNKAIALFSVNYELAICCNENNALVSQQWPDGNRLFAFYQSERTEIQYIFIEKILLTNLWNFK